MNCELTGFCCMQIGSVEHEIRNSKENLHTKIFLIHFNRKSGTFAVCHVVYSKLLVYQERLYASMDLNATCTKLIVMGSVIQMSWFCICRRCLKHRYCRPGREVCIWCKFVLVGFMWGELFKTMGSRLVGQGLETQSTPSLYLCYSV